MNRAALSPEDPLARAIAALEVPPAPPPVERVLARLGEAPRKGFAGPLGWGRPTRVAIAAVLLFALIVGALVRDAIVSTRRRDEARNGPALVASILEGSPAARRGGREIPIEEAAAGDAIRADEPARLALGRGLVAALDAGAEVVLEGPVDVRVTEGRVRFEVEGEASGRARVATRTLVILDEGTRFAVDLARDADLAGAGADAGGRERVRVTVEDGSVLANGTRVTAGTGLAFLGGTVDGLAWPLDARPTVVLEAETPSPAVGEPVVLRIVLRNATGGWIPLPEPDPVRAPLFVEVTPPGGEPSLVRVTSSLLYGTDAPPTAIPPRGEAAYRVRFDRTFASEGTYRLRAVYRPAGAVERPASPEVQVTVRR